VITSNRFEGDTQMSADTASPEIRTQAAEDLADRYVALWNEPDPERRRELLEGLWVEDGSHILQPPEELREIASRPGLGLAATLEARGHDELEARAATAYEQWVGSGTMTFRRRDDVERLADVVKFHWEGVSPDGEVTGVGLDFLVLDPDGRIARDYQFIVG
jgi:hypothetical protein